MLSTTQEFIQQTLSDLITSDKYSFEPATTELLDELKSDLEIKLNDHLRNADYTYSIEYIHNTTATTLIEIKIYDQDATVCTITGVVVP